MYNKTECLIEICQDSDSDFYIEKTETETSMDIDICLLSEN
jgi:hypothetical protein